MRVPSPALVLLLLGAAGPLAAQNSQCQPYAGQARAFNYDGSTTTVGAGDKLFFPSPVLEARLRPAPAQDPDRQPQRGARRPARGTSAVSRSAWGSVRGSGSCGRRASRLV